jgi:hypothetical protein
MGLLGLEILGKFKYNLCYFVQKDVNLHNLA